MTACVELIQKAAKNNKDAGMNPYEAENIPPQMRKTLQFGSKVWKLINRKGKNKKKPGELIKELTRLIVE